MTFALALVTSLLVAAEPPTPVDVPVPGPAPDADAPPPSPAAPATPPAAAPEGARARFTAARAALYAGDLAAASRGFDEVAADPAAPAGLAEAARVLSETSRELSRRGLVLREPLQGGQPAVDRSGRGELAWFATIYGILVANSLATAADVEEGKAYLALTLIGGGGGLALALGTTKTGPMSRGRAAAIQAATLWTSVNTAVIAAIAEADGDTAVALTVGSGLVALATAAAATGTHAPTEGDVSLVGSGGFWGLSAAALSMTFLQDVSGPTAGWILLGGTDLGLLAGYALANRHDLSRGRVLVIDAAGVLGALAGVAIPVFADSESPEAYGGAALAGIAGGLALGTWATRGWDREDGAPRVAVAAPFATRLADGTVLGGLTGRF